MHCIHVQDRLVARLDGELPRGELARVDDHLKVCLRCARLARAHKMLGLSVPQSRVDTREPGFWDAMDDALRREAHSTDSAATGDRFCGTGDQRWIALLH